MGDIKLPLWEEILKRRVGISQALGDAGATDAARLIALEIDGGKCPECKKLWARVEFMDREEVERHYYQPDCACYPRCPRCRRWLYEEFATGVLQADDWRCECGYQLWQKDAGRDMKRYGPMWEAHYNALSPFHQHRDGGGVKLPIGKGGEE